MYLNRVAPASRSLGVRGQGSSELIQQYAHRRALCVTRQTQAEPSSVSSSSMPNDDKLTFLEDKVILIISSLGLLLVTAAVLWVVRQSPDWGAINRLEEDDDGAEGLLRGRTRVVAGGREALKAARKQAKKRAKAEFRESSAGQKRRHRVHEVRNTYEYH